jgi:hypothetical protein
MQSTPTPQDTDPHDVFVIEPNVVLAARQSSPDPVQELLSHLAQKAAQASPEASAVPKAVVPTPAVDTPTVDTTFRAAAIDKIDTTDRPVVPDERPGIGWWVKRAFIAFMFALCSAFAAAAWTHHGAAARQMISSWLPPFVLAALPVSDKPVADKPAAAEQPDSAPAQAAAADSAPAQPASASQAPAQPSNAATPAVAAPTPAMATPTPAMATATLESAPSPESIARDLKTMGQQIEQLKASQAQMSRDIAKNSEAKNSEAKTAEPSPRPRAAALPPRPIPAPPRKPRTAYLPPPAAITAPPPTYAPSPTYAAPPALPPPPLPQPVVSQPALLPEATYPSDDGPVVRPPMPLR